MSGQTQACQVAFAPSSGLNDPSGESKMDEMSLESPTFSSPTFLHHMLPWAPL